jgi:hypothetical protein
MVQEKSVILCCMRFFAKQESARRNGIESKRIPALLSGSKNAANPINPSNPTDPSNPGYEKSRRAEGQNVRRSEDRVDDIMKPPIRHFRDLEVYRRAFSAAMRIFELTKRFPAEEKFALIDQCRRLLKRNAGWSSA